MLVSELFSLAKEVISFVNYKKEVDKLEDSLNKNTIIEKKLKDLLEAYEADRILVLSFHNGGHYYNGEPMQKFSCTHEVCADGISHVLDNIQKIPVIKYQSLITKLLSSSDSFSMEDVDKNNDQVASHLVSRMKERGTQSFYNVLLRHPLNETLIGILSVEYVKTKESLDMHSIGELRGLAADLSESLCSKSLIDAKQKKLELKIYLWMGISAFLLCLYLIEKFKWLTILEKLY
jgi:hypothetical protein